MPEQPADEVAAHLAELLLGPGVVHQVLVGLHVPDAHVHVGAIAKGPGERLGRKAGAVAHGVGHAAYRIAQLHLVVGRLERVLVADGDLLLARAPPRGRPSRASSPWSAACAHGGVELALIVEAGLVIDAAVVGRLPLPVSGCCLQR